MAEATPKRLQQAAKDLNVGMDRVVEALAKKGIQVENKPTTKLTGEQVASLEKEFAASAHDRQEAQKVIQAKRQSDLDAAPKPAAPVVAPPHEVDLHLEALRPNSQEGLSNTAILRIQLDAFEDALSRALATNMHEIVFIHGMGNGVLRKEIHRQLSRNKDIKFFEDARKEKFGFGATLVRLK